MARPNPAARIALHTIVETGPTGARSSGAEPAYHTETASPPDVKIRSEGRMVAVAVPEAVGLNTKSRREVPGLDVGPSKVETFWTDFLKL